MPTLPEIDPSSANSRQYTVVRGIFGGLVVMVRKAKPADAPGSWKWGWWHRAGKEDINLIVRKLL